MDQIRIKINKNSLNQPLVNPHLIGVPSLAALTTGYTLSEISSVT